MRQQIIVNVKPAASAPATPAGQSASPAAAAALPLRRRLKQAAILPSAVVPSAATVASSGDHGATGSGSSDPPYPGALQMDLMDSAGLNSANTLNGQRSIAPQRAALSSAVADLGSDVAHTCRVLYGEHTVLDLGETQTTGVLQRELS